MTDISVIILVGKEERHIGRCLEKLASLEPRQIFVIESQKGDRTHAVAVETAHSLGWVVDENRSSKSKNGGVDPIQPKQSRNLNNQTILSIVWNDWPGNQAAQFNWAIDNLPVEGEWVLRLDADEYLFDETIAELKELVTAEGLPEDVTSLSLSLARCFCGRHLRFTKDIVLVRVFRHGFGRSSQSEMDEHIVITSGRCHHMRGKFADDSLMPMDEWREKHRNYAKREAMMAVAGCANANKRLYYRLPPYFRAFAYFSIRYFLKGGFLDGYAGWMWNFWQGLWYRLLVDREIARLRREGFRA